MVDNTAGGGGGDNLVIHTMKDDLTGAGKPAANSSPVIISPPSTAPKPSAALAAPKPVTPVFTPPPRPAAAPLPTPKPSPAPVAAPPAPSGQFPLPPRSKAAAEPEPVATAIAPQAFTSAPNLNRRNRRRLAVWGAGLAIFILIVGGGAWAFITFVSAPPAAPEESPAAVVARASEILPASTGLAVHYRLETPADRGQLLELWQNSPKTLLQGNPKSLLSDANVKQFMYVGIPGEARPFLVIPKAEMSEQNLSQFSAAQVAEVSGWYILHALNATPYKDATVAGTGLGAIGNTLDEKTDGRPLKMYLSEIALNQIRSRSAGEPFTAGSVKKALLSVSVTSDGRAFVLDGVGETNPGSPIVLTASTPVDQTLLTAIPADITFARLGGSLTADIAAWQEISRVIDKTILEQSTVASLIRQLTTPYAYYQRLGVDGAPDLGLVAKFPPEATPKIALGDPALEQALPAILPLVLPEKPVSALSFSDGLYQTVPIRFVNISGPTKALDYTIQENVLHLASSKEGMFAALDTVAGRAPALEESEPWKTLFTEWGAVPITGHLGIGYLNFTSLLELLPSAEEKLPAAITEQSSSTGLHLNGVVLLSTQPSPAASGTPNPAASALPSSSPTPTPDPVPRL